MRQIDEARRFILTEPWRTDQQLPNDPVAKAPRGLDWITAVPPREVNLAASELDTSTA